MGLGICIKDRKIMKKNYKINILAILLIIVTANLYVTTQTLQAQGLIGAMSDLFAFSFPHHPRLKKVSESTRVVNSVKRKTIKLSGDVSLSVSAVLEFYKKVLSERGWKNDGEHSNEVLSVIQFHDDELRIISLTAFKRSSVFSGLKKAGIFANTVEDKLIVMMRLGGSMKEWILKKSDDDYDMPGFDFSWLGRYPGSYRVQSLKDSTGPQKAEYALFDNSCVECVMNHYKQKLLSSGWKLVHSTNKGKREIQKATQKQMEKMQRLYKSTGIAESIKQEGGVDIKEKMQSYYDNYSVLPSEVLSNTFTRKGDQCNIRVIYLEERPRNIYQQMIEEQLAALKEDLRKDALDPQEPNPEYIQEQIGLYNSMMEQQGIDPKQMEEVNLFGEKTTKYNILQHIEQLRPLFYLRQSHKEQIKIEVSYQSLKSKVKHSLKKKGLPEYRSNSQGSGHGVQTEGAANLWK